MSLGSWMCCSILPFLSGWRNIEFNRLICRFWSNAFSSDKPTRKIRSRKMSSRTDQTRTCLSIRFQTTMASGTAPRTGWIVSVIDRSYTHNTVRLNAENTILSNGYLFQGIPIWSECSDHRTVISTSYLAIVAPRSATRSSQGDHRETPSSGLQRTSTTLLYELFGTSSDVSGTPMSSLFDCCDQRFSEREW